MKKITDINGKIKRVFYIKKVTEESEEFVEAKVKGKNSNWVVWYPLADFIEKNPSVVLE